MRNLLKAARFMAPYKKTAILAVCFAILGSLMNVLIPRQISSLADIIRNGIGGQIDLGAVERTVLIGAIAILLGFVFNYGQSFLLTGVSGKMTRDIRIRLSDKLDRLPLSRMDGMSAGDLLSRTTNDVSMFSETFTTNLGTIASNAVLLVGCLVMMLINSPLLTVVVVITTILGLLVSTALTKVSTPKFIASRTLLGKVNGFIEEILTGHLVVKAFNCEDEVKEAFDKQNEELASSDWKSQFISSLLMPVMVFAGNLSYVAVCVVGSYLMINGGGISIGTIIAFILYANMFSGPLSSFASISASLQPAFAAQDRIFELLEADEMEDRQKTGLTSVRGQVTFDHVKFGYLPDQTIIQDFSADIQAGMKVAIVGPTGAGKTTLVNLLMRFYELNAGHILLDGIPISEMSREDLHRVLGMVLQETWAFRGTIRENIIYSTENVSEERFQEVLRETGLDHLISVFPDGAETEISEKMELSAGQLQLITIARAMIKDPSVLILDEATSSIDTRTEMLIQQALDSLTANRTSFVIAHRLSTIRNADMIFVLKDGDIVEVGKHEELLKQKGLYSELYYSQFAGGTMNA